MKNIIKKSLYSTAGALLVAQSSLVSAGLATQVKNTSTNAGGLENGNTTNANLVTTVENIIAYAVGLLYFAAICYALYGGFQILTAGGDDGKVKKGKTTLINAAMGLAAIFLASTIINWVINIFTSASNGIVTK